MTAKPPGPGATDARHLDPTGVDGATGDQANPWRTLSFALQQLAPNQALYVHAGDYDGGVTSPLDGPLWIIGEPGARIIDPPTLGVAPLLTLKNRSWVVRDLEFVATVNGAIPLLLRGATDTLVIGVQIQNFHAGAGIVVRNSNDCGVIDCTISGEQAWPRAGQLQEAHGLLIGSGSHRVAIAGCRSSNNRGDSIQIQDEADNYNVKDPQRPPPDPPRDIIVQDCILFESSVGGPAIGENGVDVKSCERVVIVGNEIYGFRSNTTFPNESRWGDAIVIQCDADKVIVEKNRIRDCGRAASVGATGIGAGTHGVGKVIFRFNRIYDMKLQPGVGLNTSGSGIRCSPARQIEIYHNTFHALQYQQNITTGVAIRLGDDGTVTRAVVLNNIVSVAGIALTVNDVGRLGSRSNIYHAASGTYGQPIAIDNQGRSLASWQLSGNECNSVDTDPQFVAPATHNYRTQPASPARDTAVPISGSTQVVYGAGPDIGAVETP
jgi:hypothetical protein